MKTLHVFAILGLVLFLSGCKESTTDPVIEESTLELSAQNLTLTSTTPIDSALVELSCGCGFTLVVESYSGDTSVIGYDEYDASNGRHRVGLTFSANTNTDPGTYTTHLAFLSTGSKGNFRDTIHVTYNR